MKPGTVLSFILKSMIVGLAMAFIAVVLHPEWLRQNPRVVEIRTAAPALPGRTAEGLRSYADAVAHAAPAVVNVYTAKRVTQRVDPYLDDPLLRRFFGDAAGQMQQQVQTSLGSGVIVSAQGYVLTNNHVIEGADEIQVMLADGRSIQARLVGSDPESDLAVLRIALDKLPTITLGDSQHLRVGDVVLAIGNPFGVGQTVTHGIVSATGRNRLGINTFEDFIQTDAAINPGNSGGALISPDGTLVGINTAIFSRSGGSQGIGFAIPVSLAQGVMQQIIEHGSVVRGWLGIETQDLTPELAQRLGLHDDRGVLVTGVLRGSPAQQAGLIPGDVITRIDETAVADAGNALKLIAAHAPGSRIHLQGRRAGTKFSFDAPVGTRPVQPQQ
jgi:serine protease DegS